MGLLLFSIGEGSGFVSRRKVISSPESTFHLILQMLTLKSFYSMDKRSLLVPLFQSSF